MHRKVWNKVRNVLQVYAGETVRGKLWDAEFSSGRWNCLDSTEGDVVYKFVEKYLHKGSILDLGCGSGSTGNELASDAYQYYMGVDISAVALAKARSRTKENAREIRNEYVQSDISTYEPLKHFDVILFRDSLYYIPRKKIKTVLTRYSHYLNPDGVFVVRMCDGNHRFKAIKEIIADNFDVVETQLFDQPNALVLVFRESKSTAQRS